MSSQDETQRTRRADFLIWEDYFMSIAFLAKERSKHPSHQVGACIVDQANRIVGIGYNGFPTKCSDDKLPWDQNSYVCHAPMNAILHKTSVDVKNCSMYVGSFPCNECAKVIIQSRITNIYYFSDKKKDEPKYIASKRMFDAAGVIYEQYTPERRQIEINFN